MPTIAVTFALSDVITIEEPVLIQAFEARIALYLSDATPDPADVGIVLAPGQMLNLPDGDFRARTVDAPAGRLSYQPCNLCGGGGGHGGGGGGGHGGGG